MRTPRFSRFQNPELQTARSEQDSRRNKRLPSWHVAGGSYHAPTDPAAAAAASIKSDLRFRYPMQFHPRFKDVRQVNTLGNPSHLEISAIKIKDTNKKEIGLTLGGEELEIDSANDIVLTELRNAKAPVILHIICRELTRKPLAFEMGEILERVQTVREFIAQADIDPIQYRSALAMFDSRLKSDKPLCAIEVVMFNSFMCAVYTERGEMKAALRFLKPIQSLLQMLDKDKADVCNDLLQHTLEHSLWHLETSMKSDLPDDIDFIENLSLIEELRTFCSNMNENQTQRFKLYTEFFNLARLGFPKLNHEIRKEDVKRFMHALVSCISSEAVMKQELDGAQEILLTLFRAYYLVSADASSEYRTRITQILTAFEEYILNAPELLGSEFETDARVLFCQAVLVIALIHANLDSNGNSPEEYATLLHWSALASQLMERMPIDSILLNKMKQRRNNAIEATVNYIDRLCQKAQPLALFGVLVSQCIEVLERFMDTESRSKIHRFIKWLSFSA